MKKLTKQTFLLVLPNIKFLLVQSDRSGNSITGTGTENTKKHHSKLSLRQILEDSIYFAVVPIKISKYK